MGPEGGRGSSRGMSVVLTFPEVQGWGGGRGQINCETARDILHEPSRFHTTTREPKRAHLRVTMKIPQEDPRESTRCGEGPGGGGRANLARGEGGPRGKGGPGRRGCGEGERRGGGRGGGEEPGGPGRGRRSRGPKGREEGGPGEERRGRGPGGGGRRGARVRGGRRGGLPTPP